MATKFFDNIRNHETNYDITDVIRYQKEDVGRFVLRIMIGGLMLFHGVHKILYGTEMVTQTLQNAGIPSMFTFGVFLGEVIGPIMMIVGYKTRIGAAFVVLDMITAVLLVHVTQITLLNEGGGLMIELNLLYLMGAIAVLFLGSGSIAISKGKGVLD